MSLKILSPIEYLEKLQQRKYKAQEDYVLMYSSWFEGFVDQPSLMTVPVDDPTMWLAWLGALMV